MRSPQPGPERRTDSDGVTRVTPSHKTSGGVGPWLIGGATAVTGLCVGLCLWWLSRPVPVEDLPPIVVAARPAPVAPSVEPSRPSVRPAAVPVAAPTPVEEPAPMSADEPPPPEGKTGTALYQRGTKPLKRGLVVPDDFELPPGFMRHYQATDNGQPLAAILMFHPDFTPRDANGQLIPIPENRVVPEELAPPGMPHRLLEIPVEDEDSQ
ncbi:hypothetical protein [Corallococcus aberystwythensis]|uniref:Uncharacterized protein n=1 Tax=Corallococcus aberystwythensis TaxID=2316722 RepID=A0A3A8Q068_9BACT|nr:hypothetical protein [Corallococcus aberystwythensis]RKH61538.1 hypothetical protein D7W81_23675 [Corallococcus aberystwythensis]